MAGEVMTCKEVAAVLGCSARWVCELIKRGDIPAKRFGKSWAIDRQIFRRYQARREKVVIGENKAEQM